MSYTTFEYLNAHYSAELLHPSDTLIVSVSLKNTGSVAGKEVVQLYVRDVVSSVVTPVKQLKAFSKPFLQPGEMQTVVLKLPIQELALYDLSMKKVVEEEKVHLEGAKQLFELPEFNSLEVAKNFVNILDEKELMADMLNTGITKDINVYIGEENEKDELKDFSIVTFKHRIGNKDLGTIGIIGPKRMDYAKVISVMKYISKKLNDNNNSNE